MINGVGPLEFFEATVGPSVIANSSFVRENEIRGDGRNENCFLKTKNTEKLCLLKCLMASAFIVKFQMMSKTLREELA